MATAGLNRMMLWGDYEGRKLEERWLLGHLVRPEGRRAWFEAIAPDGVPVMLSITEALNDEDELLAMLRTAAEIRHRHVVAIREAVISHLDDVPVVVAAMEMTEENLGDVLRERLLTAAEGRQVLDAVLAALGAMHAQGLIHRHVEAASVVAMGETIKLRSDCLVLAGSGFGAAAADDVRCAARMATHAVTGKFPASENDPVLQLLPEPMARAVRRALIGNAGATEVAALAGTRLELMPELQRDGARIEPYSKTAKAAVEAATPKMKAAESTSAMTPETRPAAKLDAKASTPMPRIVAMRPADERMQAALFDEPFMLPNEREAAAHALEDDEAGQGQWPKAIYVIAAAIAVVLVTVFTLYGMLHHESEQAPKSATPAPSAMVVPIAAKPADMPVRAGTSGRVAGGGWRVVAYTYNYEKTAQEKARALGERFAELNPEVFAPKGGDVWLVTLGGMMNRADALMLRNKAVNMGLPEDTYAQSFR